MSEERARNYLHDLGPLVKEKALAAKDQRDSARPGDAEDFAAGQLHAFLETISLMQQQADAFGIDRSEIGLDGIDPEADLL